jgi:two-component system cell cycle sensor histidine kinase/response regulator CckA
MEEEWANNEVTHLLSDLRRRAEKMLGRQPGEVGRLAAGNTTQLLHELQVHQIELELQNEELRRSQLELAASREKYFELYDLAPVGYLTISEKGTILEANLTVAGLLGLERRDLIRQPVTGFIFKEDQDIYRRHRKQLLQTRAPQTSQLRMIKRDGHPFWVQMDAILAQASGDQPLFWITVSDITALKRSEEQRLEERRLQQTQKLESLSVLAGGVAHEFNNLLMAIQGQAELALQELSAWPVANERIQEILKASRRAADLSAQMLTYTSRRFFQLKRADLGAIAEETAHLLKTSINKRRVLRLKLEPGLPAVQGDASQIQQVVMNLIINACEAIGERNGVITVSTGTQECTESYLRESCLENDLPAGLYVYLKVSDTGCGMDDETQRRIFEPFFTTKFTGRGLGLAAVLGIVRAHKGTLKLYSEPLKGSTLTVLFSPSRNPERGE